MVDEARVARLLRSVTDDLAVLRAESAADPDRLWLSGVTYLFVTAIEGCVDVARLADLSDLDAFAAAVAARL
ncbi:hypothetical protein ND486_06290 [Pseudonocardia sp. DR1-2]|uniref:hypothetical protein n=1 Tax=Pseudonocardia sp. DR1-2 TaxID=2951168 RepID=UPI002043A7E5|nr:hypothetical protein [Pseudonocardia sp. DR1-2]MCM3845803.1 hypothetical protein [Pseudonocardia sp. DR1-2]